MGHRRPAAAIPATGIVFVLLLSATPLGLGQTAPQRDPFDQAASDSQSKGQDKPQPDEPTTPPRPGGLRMSRAVVCESIDGFENYKPLPGAAQTSEEKLLIYYRPLRYKIEEEDGFYLAHLTQDNEIRKRGKKEIVRQKKKVVEYNPKSKDPLGPIFIRNTISLKGLEPGDYDLTIILHDERDKAAPPTRQVVKFKVIPTHNGARQKPAAKKSEGASSSR